MSVIKLRISLSLFFCLADGEAVKEVSVTEVKEWDELESLLTKAQKVYSPESEEKPTLAPASTEFGSESTDCNFGNAMLQVDRSSMKSKSGSHSRVRLSQTGSKNRTVSNYKSNASVSGKGNESGLRKMTKGAPRESDASGVGNFCQVDGKRSSSRLDRFSGKHESGSTRSGSGDSSKFGSTPTLKLKARQDFSIKQNGCV